MRVLLLDAGPIGWYHFLVLTASELLEARVNNLQQPAAQCLVAYSRTHQADWRCGRRVPLCLEALLSLFGEGELVGLAGHCERFKLASVDQLATQKQCCGYLRLLFLRAHRRRAGEQLLSG